MANALLAKYKRDGYDYIPDSIRPDTFVQCSFDNIDLLEATIDGKNSFHSTHATYYMATKIWSCRLVAYSLPFDVQTVFGQGSDGNIPQTRQGQTAELKSTAIELSRRVLSRYDISDQREL